MATCDRHPGNPLPGCQLCRHGSMTERELARAVYAICDQLGLLWHHCWDSRGCEGIVGLPDLIAIGEHGLVLAELKAEDGNTTTGQHRWLRTAARAGACDWHHDSPAIRAVIWRPADFASGRIRAELEAIA